MTTLNGENEFNFNIATHPDLLRLQGAQDRISFTDVTFRNFALRADINRLQIFCDSYLNFVDDHNDDSGNYFKPLAPYVTLSMLNYGRMATESENLGWFAQHEVLFSVPVEWYKINKKGELVFHDWAYVCPFIFVDNDQSLGVGREVYGWSKVRAWLQPVTTSWTSDPRKPRRLLSMGTSLFPRLYAGDRAESRTLIEIAQDAPPSLFRSPFSREDPHNPWWGASRNMRRSVSAMFGACEAMLGLPIAGYDRSNNMGSFKRMYQRLTQNMLAGIPMLRPGFDTLNDARARSVRNPASPYMNNITLKQFRDAEQPDYACYQALVNSKVSVERFADGGLLGGPNLLMGDITGGYRVRLHQYAEQPIAETLGLVVDSTEHDEFGTPVAVLSPLLPNWAACDLRYDMGETLCWRTKKSKWERAPDEALAVTPDLTLTEREDKKLNRYNTTRSAAMQDSVGPYHYPDTTMRVLPLLADGAQLQAFCDDYLNNLDVRDAPPESGFSYTDELAEDIHENKLQPWGNYVYMVITSYGDQMGKMYTEQNNLGQTANREFAIWLPVKWITKNSAGEETVRVAILTPYVYSDSMRTAISESEVNGRPVKHSRIDSNDEHWLKESGPVADKKMLATLRTLLTPAMNMGQPAEIRELFEVLEGDVAGYNEDIPWAAIKANWKPELDEDYAAKVREKRQWNNDSSDVKWQEVKDLFTKVIGNELPINFITLKQYRQTGQINKYCYQALVLVKKKIKTLWDIREMPARMHVGIHTYPTVPVVKQLGIKIKTVTSKNQAVIPQIEPIRPFFIRASMVEEVGVNLYSRVLGDCWKRETAELSMPDDRTQKILQRLKEPKAVIESLLYDSWGGHDTSNPYSNQSTREYPGRRVSDDSDKPYKDREPSKPGFAANVSESVEFFMRPKNFGLNPVNSQVFKANSPSDDED